jgi:catechol 2,3-dioxygenase-like lactoylglutathione lyase family enzyme
MITGFYHTGFVVIDLDAMISFYRDVLGLASQFRGDERLRRQF